MRRASPTPFVAIPLMSRREVVGFAYVDVEDAELVVPYRWICAGGYAVSGRLIMHRFILGLTPGEGVCHHVNEDKLDNRRANLQVFATASEANSQPHPKAYEVGRRARLEWAERWAARERRNDEVAA